LRGLTDKGGQGCRKLGVRGGFGFLFGARSRAVVGTGGRGGVLAGLGGLRCFVAGLRFARAAGVLGVPSLSGWLNVVARVDVVGLAAVFRGPCGVASLGAGVAPGGRGLVRGRGAVEQFGKRRGRLPIGVSRTRRLARWTSLDKVGANGLPEAFAIAGPSEPELFIVLFQRLKKYGTAGPPARPARMRQ
jgi:hypothetical protein